MSKDSHTHRHIYTPSQLTHKHSYLQSEKIPRPFKSRRLQPSDVIGHCVQQGRRTVRERPLSSRRSGGGWAQARILSGGALTLPHIGESA